MATAIVKAQRFTPVAPACRVWFSPPIAAHLVACPECGEPPRQSARLEAMIGFRLVGPEHPSRSLPEAVAASLPASGLWAGVPD